MDIFTETINKVFEIAGRPLIDSDAIISNTDVIFSREYTMQVIKAVYDIKFVHEENTTAYFKLKDNFDSDILRVAGEIVIPSEYITDTFMSYEAEIRNEMIEFKCILDFEETNTILDFIAIKIGNVAIQ